MKKTIFICLLAILSVNVLSDAATTTVRKGEIKALVRQYEGTQGFELINVGRFGSVMLKTVARLSSVYAENDKAADIIKLANGMENVMIVNFGNCSEEDKSVFVSRLENSLSRSCPMLEVCKGEHKFKIYGTSYKNNPIVRNVVIYSSDSSSLFCLFGKVNMDTIMKWAEL